MCVTSMIMDYYGDKWGQPARPWVPARAERAEQMMDLQALLDRAKAYDKVNNEPLCESQAKEQKLLALATEIFGEGDEIVDDLREKFKEGRQP